MKSGYKLPETELARVLLGFKRIFATVGVFSAIINLLLLVPALYMLQVYDRVLASRNETTLLMLTLMVVGAYLLMGSLEFVRSFVLIRVGAQFDMRMNKPLFITNNRKTENCNGPYRPHSNMILKIPLMKIHLSLKMI